MSETGDKPARVGVRELRQNLSVYLDRVKAGETLVVTEHGDPVARLAPPTRFAPTFEQLVADGTITPPIRDHRDETPPPPPHPDDHGPSALEILLQMREEEEY